jgi:hypothetical protein
MTTPALAMTLGQIKTRVKRTFGDLAEVQINDQDITDWVNASMRDLVKLNNLSKFKGSTDAVQGQKDYNLPVGVSSLTNVKYAGSMLEYMSQETADQNIPGRDVSSNYPTGTPQFYTVYNDILTLYPAPDTSVTAGITLYYTQLPAPVAADEDVPGIPVEYHNRIVDYCLAQAYELNGDINSYQIKMTGFTEGRRELQGKTTEEDSGLYPFVTDMSDYLYAGVNDDSY